MAARASSRKKTAAGTAKKTGSPKTRKGASKKTATRRATTKKATAKKAGTKKAKTTKRAAGRKSTTAKKPARPRSAAKPAPAGSGAVVHTRLLGVSRHLLGPSTTADGGPASGAIIHKNLARDLALKRLLG